MIKVSGLSANSVEKIIWTLDGDGYFEDVPVYSGRFPLSSRESISAKLEMLFDKSNEDCKKENKPWSTYGQNQQIPSIHVYTHLSNACNLRCSYCFTAANERMDESLSFPVHMPRDTIEMTLKSFCVLVRHRYGAGMVNLVLFGGEPTLKGELRETLYWTIKRACDVCREERVFLHIAILTNGTQVDDELLEYVKKYNIGFSLSCDLPLEAQDNVRCFSDGKGSSAEIEHAIQLLKKHKVSFGTRTTVTNFNQNRIVEAMDYAKSLDLHSITAMPVDITLPLTESDKVRPPDPEVLCSEYLKSWNYAIELYRSCNYLMKVEPLSIVAQRITGGGSYRGCGMGEHLFSVSTNGEVHSCFKLRRAEYRLANVSDHDFVDKMEHATENQKSQSFDDYFQNSCDKKSEGLFPCSKCNVLVFCTGGCIARSMFLFDTRSVGNGYFNDSSQPGDTRCEQTRRLYTTLFWDYIDLPQDDKVKLKYYQTIAKVQSTFWGSHEHNV